MHLKNLFEGLVILSIFVLIAFPSATAFSVTGKQITAIHSGTNNQEIVITNSGDDVLVAQLTATNEQYYTPQDVPFIVSENWEQKFNDNVWQRVEWLSVKRGEVILAPYTEETIGFAINIPENITKGTFYAKLEVKDIGKKEGMVVIRPVYVSQVVAHIIPQQEDSSTSLPWCSYSITFLFLILIATILLVMKRGER